jgi:hypothetical protein
MSSKMNLKTHRAASDCGQDSPRRGACLAHVQQQKEAAMTLYAAFDLHSNNGVLSVIDEHDHVVFERRLPNDLEQVLQALAPFLATLKALAVEWLVDGLMDAGVDVRRVNTAAVPQ